MRNFAWPVAGLIAILSGLPAEPVAAQSASDPQPSTVLVELTGSAKMIGYPAVCPGSAPGGDPEEICMAELYEAPAKVLRHLDGQRLPSRINVRFTAHSFSAVWDKHVRFLLIVAPFEDKGRRGHFARYWDWEDDRGLFCKGVDDLDDLPGTALKRLYLARRANPMRGDDARWSEHCVTGTERLAKQNG